MKRSLIASLSTLLIFGGLLAACGELTPQATSTPPTSKSTDIATSVGTETATSIPTETAAFVNLDRNVYVWTSSTPNFVQIAATGDAQTAYPSPDGRLVAFIRTTDYQTYNIDVVRSDGADHRTLFSQDQFLALPRPEGTLSSAPLTLQWIPGSHLLAMTTRVVIQGPGTLIGKDLLVINADDGTFDTRLTESAGFTFTFSPDGKYIATGLADGVNLYDANGKAAAPAKFFDFPEVNTSSEYQYMPDIQWSLDGTRFAFFIPPVSPFFDPNGTTRVIEVKANDASYTTPIDTRMQYQYPMVLSPDFSFVAYTVITDPSIGAADLHIASMDGKKDVIYVPAKKTNQFSWSPDNRHFLFAYNDDRVTVANLGEVDGAGTTIPQVTSMRGGGWIDATHYMIVDKADSGWQVWSGQIGTEPKIVYSDTITDDGTTSLTINR